MDLQIYLIDVVVLVPATEEKQAGVQMLSYSVAGRSAEHAFERFVDEGAGEVVFRGEVVPSVVIGIEKYVAPAKGVPDNKPQ